MNTDNLQWELRKSGPADAPQRVLMLPGGICTAAFFDDLTSEPALAQAPIQLVAATFPGFAGTPPPPDVSIESYARLAGDLARTLGSTVVVGHSFGANVAIEMVGAKVFTGPLVLISPAFSSADEMKGMPLLVRFGRIPVVGPLPWMALMKVIPMAAKGQLPADRRGELAAELKRSDSRSFRRGLSAYFAHLDRHKSLVPRLLESGVRSWVVFGEHDDVSIAEDERRQLEGSQETKLVIIPDSGHFSMIDKSSRIAEFVLAAVMATPGA